MVWQRSSGSSGALYNQYAVSSPHSLCPSGWHVPTFADWSALESYISASYAYVAQSLASTTLWQFSTAVGSPGNDPNMNNLSGFTGKPEGYRLDGSGQFSQQGAIAGWWTSTEGDPGLFYYYRLLNNSATLDFSDRSPSFGLSVRCIRD